MPTIDELNIIVRATDETSATYSKIADATKEFVKSSDEAKDAAANQSSALDGLRASFEQTRAEIQSYQDAHRNLTSGAEDAYDKIQQEAAAISNIPPVLGPAGSAMETFGAIQTAIFAPIAIQSYINMLMQIPAAIGAISDAFRGWDALSKSVMERQISENTTKYQNNLKNEEDTIRQSERLLTGPALEALKRSNDLKVREAMRYHIKMQDLTIQESENTLKRLGVSAADIASVITDEAGPGMLQRLGEIAARATAGPERDKAMADLQQAVTLKRDAQARINAADSDAAASQIRTQQQVRDRGIANRSAQYEATKAFSLAEVTDNETRTRQMMRATTMSMEDGLVQLRNDAIRRREIEQEGFDNRRKILDAQASTGTNVAPERQRLAEQEKEADVRLAASKRALGIELQTMANKRMMDATYLAVATTQKQVDQTAAIETAAARQRYSAHDIQANEETNLVIAALQKQYDATRLNAEARIELLKLEGPSKARELQAAIDAEEQAAIKLEADKDRIREEGNRKDLAQRMAILHAKTTAELREADITLKGAQRDVTYGVRRHKISKPEAMDQEMAALDAWHEKSQKIIAQEQEDIANVYTKNSPQYAASLAKMSVMEEQYAARRKNITEKYEMDWTKMTRKMSSEMSTAFNSMIMGQQTVGQAFGQMASKMLSTLVQTLTQMLIETIAFGELKDSKEKMIYAKSIWRKVYDALADIPVIGPFIAPVAAGAAFATVMAFEKGGIVPADAFIFAHKNEMVLPAPVSRAVTDAVNAQGGVGVSQSNNAPNIHYHAGANESQASARQNANAMYGQFTKMLQADPRFA